MRLLHKDFRFRFEFAENARSLLIVEHPGIFSSMAGELSGDFSEEESRFVLSENNKIMKKKESLECIINPWSVSLNEKKLLNRAHEMLKKQIQSSDLLLENNRVYAQIEEFALLILQNTDLDLTYSQKTDVQNLIKFMDIRFSERQETLLEKLVDYTKVSHELLGVQCFVFVNLLSYLTSYEIEKMYEYMNYQKIHVLLLESRQPEELERFSNVVIIDKDACEIECGV